MSNIRIKNLNDQNLDELIALCPFNAIEKDAQSGLAINAGCRMCRICLKRKPDVFYLAEAAPAPRINKQEWQGLAVYIEQQNGCIHPVSLELIGKAREMAAKTGQQVF